MMRLLIIFYQKKSWSLNKNASIYYRSGDWRIYNIKIDRLFKKMVSKKETKERKCLKCKKANAMEECDYCFDCLMEVSRV